jgi:DNA-binding NarL/FixJ family response regulator
MKKKRYVSLAVQERLLDAVSNGNSSASRKKASNGLSHREKEVMQMLINGKWVKEIALDLNLRANTVSTYKARLFEKMGVTSVIELAKIVGNS